VTFLGIPRRDAVGLAAVAVIVAVAPLVVSAYYLSILVTVGLWGMAATGLGLLVGQARLISLGHAAFVGLGAYATGLLAVRLGWSPWLSLPAAVMLTALVAILVGLPVLRLEGHYLAMATLGLGIVFNVALREWTALTGGPSGFSSIPSLTLPILDRQSELRSLFVVWVCVLAALWLALRLMHSRVGRALRAIGESEVAAELLGLDSARLKVLVFALSAAYAALAGGLYAQYVTFLSPEPFGFVFSLELIVIAAVGGLTSVWGGVIGAAVLTLLTEALRRSLPQSLPGGSGELELILFGLVLIGIMVFRPSGIAGLGRPLMSVLSRAAR
jgi:ABC-type branched-subunit amino acid transport system permease subunit